MYILDVTDKQWTQFQFFFVFNRQRGGINYNDESNIWFVFLPLEKRGIEKYWVRCTFETFDELKVSFF